MILLPIAIAAACIWFLSPALAHEIKAGDLVIVHPMVDEAAKGQELSGGSIEIRNQGNGLDRLLSITSEFAEQTEFEGAAPVTISAKGHAAVLLLFKKIKTKLSEDEVYAGELTFEKAGKVKIDFIVHSHKH